MERRRLTPLQAKTVLQLLHSFDEEQRDRPEAYELLIAFLSSGGSICGVAAFTSDPRHGQISAGVVSFLAP